MKLLRLAYHWAHHLLTGEFWPRNQCAAKKQFSVCTRLRDHYGEHVSYAGKRWTDKAEV